MDKFLVEMRGITKRFPGVTANDAVDFTVRAGEIHALLGENGSGKSTLMSILAGLYRPDEGRILVAGRPAVFRSPRDAILAGIGMVHQHFKLVETFTAAENIVLGDDRTPFVPRMRDIEEQIARLSASYGLAVNPRARVWQLSVGERQRVEVVKMLFRGCRMLVLDEPTAVLTPQETRELFATLRRMAKNGHAVVIITHKLQEVMDLADRVTVLRHGRVANGFKRGEFNERDLARAMVGRDLKPPAVRALPARGETVLELRDVRVLNDAGLPGLQDLNLTLSAGEILGVAGVTGNGQRELAEVVTGLRPAVSGRILVGGRDVTNQGPRAFIAAGVAHIPEDRLHTGLAAGLSAVDNLILKEYRARGPGHGIFLNRKEARRRAEQLVADFDVRLASIDAPVRLLSGGNLQRLLLAREISSRPRVIVAAYPARGLDIAATESVYSILEEQRGRGAAILLISEDLDEIFRVSDRIAVLYSGRLAGPVLQASATGHEQVGLLMTGGTMREVAAG
ncbi:MAG: ABC transporter ATP-binding protein [Thermoanaerobacterales bacterium]|nr:ABC transporter ATP-binding protein [Thermoanaerobacterales bacterium]